MPRKPLKPWIARKFLARNPRRPGHTRARTLAPGSELPSSREAPRQSARGLAHWRRFLSSRINVAEIRTRQTLGPETVQHPRNRDDLMKSCREISATRNLCRRKMLDSAYMTLPHQLTAYTPAQHKRHDRDSRDRGWGNETRVAGRINAQRYKAGLTLNTRQT